jgi:hypothetical protein
MSNAAQIRAALVATLSSVPEVGLVHSYERYAKDVGALREMYQGWFDGDSQLRGWFVRRRRFSAEAKVAGRRTITTTWSITGYQALSDAAASELTLDALVDRIAEAIENNPTLSGTVRARQVADPAGVTLEDAGAVMFAGVLCNHVRLQLITEHTEINPARSC